MSNSRTLWRMKERGGMKRGEVNMAPRGARLWPKFTEPMQCLHSRWCILMLIREKKRERVSGTVLMRARFLLPQRINLFSTYFLMLNRESNEKCMNGKKEERLSSRTGALNVSVEASAATPLRLTDIQRAKWYKSPFFHSLSTSIFFIFTGSSTLAWFVA